MKLTEQEFDLIVRLEENNKAMRFNEGKRKWSLVDFKSLEPMIEALEYGAEKYSPDGWKKGYDKKEILESMMRHIASLMDGEEVDTESGVSHMGHIQVNAMFYNYFNRQKPCKLPMD